MSTVGAAIVALLFGGPALANTTTCTFTDPLGRGNATLTTVPSTTGEWPVFVPASGVVPEHWEYGYQLSPGSVPSLGTNPGVDFLIPVCSPPLSITGTSVTVSPAGFPPGAGSRFGLWTGHDNVVRVRRSVGSPNIVFSTPKLLPLHDVSAGLVTAATTASAYTCKDIVAPVCPGTSTSSGNPLVRNFESFQLGNHDCKMDVSLNADGSIASAATRSISDPNNETPGSTCFEQLPVESLRKTFLCDPNNCAVNEGGGYTCSQPTPNVNCAGYTYTQGAIEYTTFSCNTPTSSNICQWNGQYDSFNGLPLFVCSNSATPTTSIPTGYCFTYNEGTYNCPTASSDFCLLSSDSLTYTCNPAATPPGCDSGVCKALNCLPKTAVERNIIEKSGDNSKYCYNSTAGTQVCKTCTGTGAATRCVTTTTP
jgi:hypothetical protein